MPTELSPADPSVVISARSLAVSPGAAEAAALHGEHIVVWSCDSGAILRRSGAGPVARSLGALAWSPAGTVLARDEPDGTISLLNADDFAPLGVLPGHRPPGAVPPQRGVRALVFSPDGSTLASAGADRRLSLWDVSSGSLLRSLDLPGAAATWLRFSPDGTRLLAANATDSPSVWDLADDSGPSLLEDVAYGQDPRWSPDGTRLLLCDGAGALVFYDGVALTRVDRIELEVRPRTATWTGDGSGVVMTTERGSGLAAWTPSGTVAELGRGSTRPGRLEPAAGSTALLADDREGITAWDAGSPDVVRRFERPTW